jgi:hypothetical protein
MVLADWSGGALLVIFHTAFGHGNLTTLLRVDQGALHFINTRTFAARHVSALLIILCVALVLEDSFALFFPDVV